jgi:hypothetical protein
VDAKPPPVVFRTRSARATAVWAVFAVGFGLMAAVFLLTNLLGVHLSPSPWLVSAILVGVVIAVVNRARPIGLDRTGLHIGSSDEGYVLSWSNITGVVAVPRSLVQPERIRIRIVDSSLVPGSWARRRWGVRVIDGSELEVPLGYGQSGAEIADEIRRFIDAYG